MNDVPVECTVVVELPRAGRAVTVTAYCPVRVLRSVSVTDTVPLAVTRTDALDSVAVTCDGAFSDSATVPLHPPLDVSVTGTDADVPDAAVTDAGTAMEYVARRWWRRPARRARVVHVEPARDVLHQPRGRAQE